MNKIKDLLSDMRLVLCNNFNRFESDYHISARGVPYVHVIVNGRRYQFTYFGKGKFFRIFDDKQNKTDIVKRGDVIQYFRDLRGESCKHLSRIGDNYGESCLDCGKKLSGYGYGGRFGRNLTEQTQCIHLFAKAGDADAGEICIYCEQWRSETED